MDIDLTPPSVKPPAAPEPLNYWPYCRTCHKPFQFEPDEPFAYCDCGDTEWGNPRPADWVPNPRDSYLTQRINASYEIPKPDDTDTEPGFDLKGDGYGKATR